METYESVLLVKPEVFIYKIPPAGNNRRHRAAGWNLAEPTWTGRMRLVANGNNVNLKLEDKLTGVLFANCPVETYPGVAIESVSDSSRYFVIRVLGDNGRCAFLGMGFGDRSDSFDLNVALQDHFKWVKNQEQIEKDKTAPKQELDLGFKEGETIKINMKITKKGDGESSSRTGKGRPSSGTPCGFLPPPPGGMSKIAPPPGSGSVRSSPAVSPAHHRVSGAASTEWGEFASGESVQQPAPSAAAATSGTNSNWVQF